MVQIKLYGQFQQLKLDPDAALLRILRDGLQLTGQPVRGLPTLVSG